MARIYSNENVAYQVVERLRDLGHDVQTSYEAGNANKRVEDPAVPDFAYNDRRILLTNNRRDFVRLHQEGDRVGIVVFTVDVDFKSLAARIDRAIAASEGVARPLVSVTKTGHTIKQRSFR